ncbi:cytochrome c [Roseiarcaceae bacterium H3SJ34-1]|uniref:c-type cytochrome n=1 Tax=Terripilifer ovatus TaxID=3032367 RepID=UPI003AB98FA4|nr:cytochrome c [Roseiarcaceae bacterium H3SJ34-1]
MRAVATAALAALSLAAPAKATDQQSFEQVQRGRYLTTMGDCVACHTAPGGKPFAGGLTIATPFGNLLSPNITPDAATGIGAFSDDQFVNAVQNGIGSRGQRLYPALPYPYYHKMNRTDVLAIRAYLNTLDPVSNAVEPNQLPFPFNIRMSLLFWNLINFDRTPLTDDPDQSPQWNRGRYIVEGPAHCGACHTPKTWLGGDDNSQALKGAVLQGWFAPDITPDARKGIGGWSEDELVAYLKTGVIARSSASGPMAEVVVNSTSKLADADLRAVAIYLKGLKPGTSQSSRPPSADDPHMLAGKAIYKDSCAACHREEGDGIANLFPRLKGSSLVQSDDPTTLIRMVLEGSRAAATDARPTGAAMPSFAWRFSDGQVADLVTYIRNGWGNSASSVSASAVKDVRGGNGPDPVKAGQVR